MTAQLLIYGITGYTAKLILDEALARGLKPIVAGRSREAVQAIAAKHGLESRVASLDDPRAMAAMLDGVGAVLHCAGPFHRTATAMLDACLAAKAHYLDITGEIAVFEQMAAADARAKARGITVMPGTGFDVVPTDCLAAHLKRRMPGAQSITLAFVGGGSLSHGTAMTMIDGLGEPGMARIDGRVTPVPPAWRVRDIDFGDRVRSCVSIPWGDVSTAYHSTGIPNVTTLTAAGPGATRMLRLSRWIGPLLRTEFVRSRARARVAAGAAGPSMDALKAKPSRCWGEVTDAAGNTMRARLVVASGYLLTSWTAVAIAERVLAGTTPSGFLTPSRAFGPDFILDFPGTVREDLP